MGFDESKKKTLEEIIESESSHSWAETDFMKLVDAKIGLEIKKELNKLSAGISTLTEKIPGSVQKMIDSNEKLSQSNNGYARALCWLTGGLVVVGILPYIERALKFVIKNVEHLR